MFPGHFTGSPAFGEDDEEEAGGDAMGEWTRRQFMKRGAATCMALGAPFLLEGCGDGEDGGIAATPARGATVHTVLGDGRADLYEMGRRAAETLGIHAGADLSGRRVFIKPNLVVMGLEGSDNPYRAVEKVPAGGCSKSSRCKAGDKWDPPKGGVSEHTRGQIPRSEAYSLYAERRGMKPNAADGTFSTASYDPEGGECTKAEILVGIAEQCLAAGAERVTIGDGGAGLRWDWRLLSFFQGNRLFGADNLQDAIARLGQAYPLQIVELSCLNEANQWAHVPSSSDHEIMRHGLKIARSVYEADHVISVPVIKTHVHTEMTCSMKNFVGVTPSWPPYGISAGLSIRDQLHVAYANATSAGIEKAGIAACFTDIVRWRKEAGRQDFAIIDGSIGVEADGPTLTGGGSTMDLRERTPAGRYFLIASSDLAAADAAAARVMGLDPEKVNQLRMAARLGIGETRNIRVLGDATLDRLRIRGLRKATLWEEWGVASTVPSCREGASGIKHSRMVNALAGAALPGAAVCLLRHLHDRRKGAENRSGAKGDDPVQPAHFRF